MNEEAREASRVGRNVCALRRDDRWPRAVVTRGSSLFLALALAFAALPATADTVGRASVIDGDTLDIHGQRFRIFGIDAPESAQLCEDRSGQRYRCGQTAALALSDLIGQRTVKCVTKDRDRYKRDIAICTVRDLDVGRWMVSNGLALAYRTYSRAYIDAEEAASKRKTGLWAGSFQAPWDYRRAKRTRPAAKASPSIRSGS